jgi:hypothetical protein
VSASPAGNRPAPDEIAEDPRTDGLDLVRQNFRRAAASASSCPERFFRIGGRSLRLRFAGDALVAPLTRAIAHLEIERTDSPDFAIDLWDSASTSTELSPLLAGLIEMAERAPFDVLSSRYELRPLQNDRVSSTYDLGSGVLSVFDAIGNRAFYWVRDAEELPYYERGAPLRTLFNWWLSQRDLHCAHAAAVGTDDGALLLTGRGGSGKSTTALACLNAGMQYASDDYCVIGRHPTPEVYSLYNTGKLRDEVDLARQPNFGPWIANRERSGDEKLLMFLYEHAPDRLLLSAPLRAIVIPRVAAGATESELHEISPALALRALAPTSMFQLPGSAAQAMLMMAGLVKALPCYRLDAGSDIAAIPGLLRDLLTELSPTGSGASNTPLEPEAETTEAVQL